MQDDSGEIDVIQWIEEGTNQPEFGEGTPVKVIGSIRSQQDKKHVMAFKINNVSSQAEYDAHKLEVVYSHLKLKQMSQRANGEIGMTDMSQSMLGGGLGVQSAGYVSSSSNQSFGNKMYDMVYALIRQSTDEAGIDRDSIFNQAKKNMSKTEMDNALDFLSSEGHIYSTIDEDHFKTTDGD